MLKKLLLLKYMVEVFVKCPSLFISGRKRRLVIKIAKGGYRGER